MYQFSKRSQIRSFAHLFFNRFFVFTLLLSCFLTVLNAGEVSIGLGWPYIGLKYDFSKLVGEGRFATSDGINVYAGRLYYNFYSADKLRLFIGLEGGYIGFDTLDIKGTGYEGALFVGSEYFITEELSLALDFSPTFIALNSDDVKVDGVEFVCNIALYYRLFGSESSEPSEKKMAVMLNEIYQRGVIYFNNEEYELAIAEFKNVLKVAPSYKDAQQKLNESKKLLKK
ncbi:MAG: hypothetical protein PHE88_00380 [Elusimicrobia bacterium]|nr:hypothetical protein [Elusimicrobiota bacterium]